YVVVVVEGAAVSGCAVRGDDPGGDGGARDGEVDAIGIVDGDVAAVVAADVAVAGGGEADRVDGSQRNGLRDGSAGSLGCQR
ncbi:MAG: hypothetical protein QOH13_924, partial [Thermoleophilaceae bacterium]|nr:hypothetical protein [Thermoleophilaceae bacterium]